jgi:hypothetical protein
MLMLTENNLTQGFLSDSEGRFSVRDRGEIELLKWRLCRSYASVHGTKSSLAIVGLAIRANSGIKSPTRFRLVLRVSAGHGRAS